MVIQIIGTHRMSDLVDICHLKTISASDTTLQAKCKDSTDKIYFLFEINIASCSFFTNMLYEIHCVKFSHMY